MIGFLKFLGWGWSSNGKKKSITQKFKDKEDEMMKKFKEEEDAIMKKFEEL